MIQIHRKRAKRQSGLMSQTVLHHFLHVPQPYLHPTRGFHLAHKRYALAFVAFHAHDHSTVASILFENESIDVFKTLPYEWLNLLRPLRQRHQFKKFVRRQEIESREVGSFRLYEYIELSPHLL